MRHWDAEIERIQEYAEHFALAHKATAVMGVAVDDATKRDYFIPRLQSILDRYTWARHLTLRIVPMNGAGAIDLTATSPLAGAPPAGEP